MATVVTSQPVVKSLQIKEEYGAITLWEGEYIITDCTGSTTVDRAKAALALCDTNDLSFGDPIPGWDNLLVLSRSLKALTPDTFSVTIQAAALGDLEGQGVFACHCALSSSESVVDLNGAPILSVYNYGASYAINPVMAGVRYVDQVSVSCQWPTLEATVSKILTVSSPTLTMMEWIGRLNGTTWVHGAPGTWQCTNVSEKLIDGTVTASGSKYLFQWTFQYNFRGHQPRIAFHDPFAGGAIPYDQIQTFIEPTGGTWDVTGVLDVGAKKVYMYPYKEFKDLFDV